MTENEKKEKTQISLDEAISYQKETAQKALSDSIFVKIQNHETVMLPFPNPPVINKTVSKGLDKKTNKEYSSNQLEFELRAKNSEGQTKVWTVGTTNKIVAEILAMLKAGIFDIPVHREGEDLNTKYSIAKERSI